MGQVKKIDKVLLYMIERHVNLICYIYVEHILIFYPIVIINVFHEH